MRRQTTGAEVPEAYKKSFASKDEGAMVVEGNYDLDFHASKVTKRQLDTLCVHFKISSTITIRPPAYEELPLSVRKSENEIAFPVIAFEIVH